MEITRITENNLEAFAELMPEGLTQREDLMFFGAVSDTKEAVSAIAIGVTDETGVYIDWIYTEPSFREQGAATELLDTVIAFLHEMQIGRIEITYSDDDEELDDFLKNHGFVTCPEEDMYEVPVSDLIYTEQMDALLERITETDRVHTIEDPKMRDKLNSYLESLGMDAELPGTVSAGLSLVMLDRLGAPSGCMLVETPDEDSVEVSYFANTGSAENSMELVAALCGVLKSADLDDRTLIFTDKSGHTSNLVGALTGEDIDKYRVDGIYNGVCIL